MSAEPDEQLVALVGAALNRYGPTLRLTYTQHEPAPGARCVIVFPQPEESSEPAERSS